MKDILEKIKNTRIQQGITQRELARMSGVSYSTITKLESGITLNPRFIQVAKIMKALNISIDGIISKSKI